MSDHHAPSTQDAIEARKEQVSGHLDSHGHSTAAWVGVGTCTLGALVASVATVFAVVWLVVVGLVIMAVAGPLGWFLGKRGYGAQDMQGGDGEKKVVT